MFTYKGYEGQITDLEDNYFGRVLGINDVVTFKGNTVEEARQEFQNSIDDYLDFCQELGQEPDYSEEMKMMMRTTRGIMTHFKIEPLPLTQEQKDWYEANMKREIRHF